MQHPRTPLPGPDPARMAQPFSQLTTCELRLGRNALSRGFQLNLLRQPAAMPVSVCGENARVQDPFPSVLPNMRPVQHQFRVTRLVDVSSSNLAGDSCWLQRARCVPYAWCTCTCTPRQHQPATTWCNRHVSTPTPTITYQITATECPCRARAPSGAIATRQHLTRARLGVHN